MHSMFIIPLFSIALIIVLVIAYRRGKLNPERPIALLVIDLHDHDGDDSVRAAALQLLCLRITLPGIGQERRAG